LQCRAALRIALAHRNRSRTAMRAEIAAIAAEIKQSLELLRRFL
jgi:hypothetical protein